MLFVITEKSKNNKIIKKLSGFVEEFDIVFAETIKELSYYNVVQSTDAILIANDEKMNKKTSKDLPKGVKVLTLTSDSLGEELDLSQLFIQLTGKPRLGAFLTDPETLLYRPCPICSCFAHKDDFLEDKNDNDDLKVEPESKTNSLTTKSNNNVEVVNDDKDLTDKNKQLVKSGVVDNKTRSEKQGFQRKQNKHGKELNQYKSSEQRFGQKKVLNQKTSENENNKSLKENNSGNNFNKTKNESRDGGFTIKNRNKKEESDSKNKNVEKKVKEFKPINEIKTVEQKQSTDYNGQTKNEVVKDEPFELLEDLEANKTKEVAEEITKSNNLNRLNSEAQVENNNDMPFELEPEDERLDPISVMERKSSEAQEENNEISFNQDQFEQLLSGVS